LNFSGLHKANKRLSRAFSFSPEPNKSLTKKVNSPSLLLQDEWSNSFDSSKRMSVSSRQVNILKFKSLLTPERLKDLFIEFIFLYRTAYSNRTS
jgi:hypothetical protein